MSVILWTTFDRLGTIDEVLERLSKSAARPVALDVLDSNAAAAVAAEAGLELPPHRPVLCIGVEGTEPETAWQVKTLKAELTPLGPHEIVPVSGTEATKLWFALAEFQVPSDDPLTFKANLLPSRTVAFVDAAVRIGLRRSGPRRQRHRHRPSPRFHDHGCRRRDVAGGTARPGPQVPRQSGGGPLRRRLEK